MTDPTRNRAPSIRDVARLAGVSYQTVSRVLNGSPNLREETRLRVQRVMDELQYRPNRAARMLVTSRSRTIGILSASSFQFGPASSITAIEKAAREEGYFVNTVNLDGSDRESIERGLNHLLDQAIEGLVVIAPQVRVFRTFTEMNLSVPFVTLQSNGTSDHALSVDQIAGARLATRHLIELGHRNIYHLAGPQDWIEAEARMHGFLTEMSEHDVAATAPILGDWTAEFGYFAGRELLRVRDFTAIFSANDQMALGLMHAIRDAGLDVPGDISIVGFDDIPEARHFWPPLTTVKQDFAEIGRRAVAQLLQSGMAADESAAGEPADDGAGGRGEAEADLIIPELIIRGTSGAARF